MARHKGRGGWEAYTGLPTGDRGASACMPTVHYTFVFFFMLLDELFEIEKKKEIRRMALSYLNVLSIRVLYMLYAEIHAACNLCFLFSVTILPCRYYHIALYF